MAAEDVTVYWRPNCSSCMRVKEYLARCGIAFRSVNVLEEPQALHELAAQGIRSIPVVQRGDGRYAYAQFLDDVADFLGHERPARSTLDAQAMCDRLQALLGATVRYARQLPGERVHEEIAGLGRPYGDFAFHVLRIAEAFVEATARGALRDAAIVVSIPAAMRAPGDLAAYGESVVAQLATWWRTSGASEDWQRTIHTDYGDRTLWDTFERSTWHAAQHVRQVMDLWRGIGIALDGPLGDEVFEGLPLPTLVSDDRPGARQGGTGWHG